MKNEKNKQQVLLNLVMTALFAALIMVMTAHHADQSIDLAAVFLQKREDRHRAAHPDDHFVRRDFHRRVFFGGTAALWKLGGRGAVPAGQPDSVLR